MLEWRWEAWNPAIYSSLQSLFCFQLTNVQKLLIPCQCQGDAVSLDDSRPWHPPRHRDFCTSHGETSRWCYCWGCRMLLPSEAPYRRNSHHTENICTKLHNKTCMQRHLFNPLTAIFPKMPVPKPILDTTQILFTTILFVCFDNYNTYCSQFVTHLHFFIDRNLGSSHPSVPAVPWTG